MFGLRGQYNANTHLPPLLRSGVVFCYKPILKITGINMIEINRFYIENCLDTMARMPDNFIDLTVTSPPYDNLRDYNGYQFDFESIAKELYRVIKQGGAVVWVVGDSAKNGNESGESFRQALFFKEIGFNLFDTMFYHKNGMPMRGNIYGYNQVIEFMFVFSKGFIKTSNIIKDRKNQSAGKIRLITNRKVDGKINNQGLCYTKEYTRRENIWSYNTGEDEDNFNHPAKFPEKLAADHIYSWSNEDDLIYDPFVGSGTTVKMAIKLKRNWIASDISEEYIKNIAEKRIKPLLMQETLF